MNFQPMGPPGQSSSSPSSSSSHPIRIREYEFKLMPFEKNTYEKRINDLIELLQNESNELKKSTIKSILLGLRATPEPHKSRKKQKKMSRAQHDGNTRLAVAMAAPGRALAYFVTRLREFVKSAANSSACEASSSHAKSGIVNAQVRQLAYRSKFFPCRHMLFCVRLHARVLEMMLPKAATSMTNFGRCSRKTSSWIPHSAVAGLEPRGVYLTGASIALWLNRH
ncbi:hypothetical protein C8R43DRAFT_965831 [Mycena crocata]|nr:hypothetical protein C8R43DRAFT_965831 [Mycena crocata]